jgi:hypothetical protein
MTDRKGAWTEEEKMKFQQGLEKCGKGNWVDIAKYIGTGRTNNQVSSVRFESFGIM